MSSRSSRSCNRKRYQSIEDAIADGIKQTASNKPQQLLGCWGLSCLIWWREVDLNH
ncbi:hypothetical protein QUA82_19055 [Microcoleus sp. F8-D3]